MSSAGAMFLSPDTSVLIREEASLGAGADSAKWPREQMFSALMLMNCFGFPAVPRRRLAQHHE
jgi:hypothetical protein